MASEFLRLGSTSKGVANSNAGHRRTSTTAIEQSLGNDYWLKIRQLLVLANSTSRNSEFKMEAEPNPNPSGNAPNSCRLAQMILKSAQETPALLTDRSYSPTSYEVYCAVMVLWNPSWTIHSRLLLLRHVFHQIVQSSSQEVGAGTMSLVPLGLLSIIIVKCWITNICVCIQLLLRWTLRRPSTTHRHLLVLEKKLIFLVLRIMSNNFWSFLSVVHSPKNVCING